MTQHPLCSTSVWQMGNSYDGSVNNNGKEDVYIHTHNNIPLFVILVVFTFQYGRSVVYCTCCMLAKDFQIFGKDFFC